MTRMGEKLVAWRDSGGKVTVMHDLCPHRGVALSAGEVHGDYIWCPFHGFEYDASGRCTVIPANGKATPAPKVFRVQTLSHPRDARPDLHLLGPARGRGAAPALV